MKFPILLIAAVSLAEPATATPLPIRTSPAIVHASAFETPQKLVVSGSVRSSLRSPSAHVDVLLVGRGGAVLAREVEALAWPHPRTAVARHGNLAFTGDFPIAEARNASAIVVRFSTAPHSRCLENSNG
jgi:hypothetical protein